MHTKNTVPINLPSLQLPVKSLFTGYLLALGIGLLMAGAQIFITHGMADGKLGISVDDIVYSYYGNRGNSRLEAKLNGSMKDKATVDERTEIIKWVHQGAPVNQWNQKIQAVFQQNCVQCHGAIPGLPDFNDLAVVQQYAQVDKGASYKALTKVSHIHLFAIGFIFFFVGFIFSFAVGITKTIKALLIIFPFVFLIVDVMSWWLTKWYPGFAWLTIIGGFGYGMASTFMIFTSLYQMWVLPFKTASYSENTWL